MTVPGSAEVQVDSRLSEIEDRSLANDVLDGLRASRRASLAHPAGDAHRLDPVAPGARPQAVEQGIYGLPVLWL